MALPATWPALPSSATDRQRDLLHCALRNPKGSHFVCFGWVCVISHARTADSSASRTPLVVLVVALVDFFRVAVERILCGPTAATTGLGVSVGARNVGVGPTSRIPPDDLEPDAGEIIIIICWTSRSVKQQQQQLVELQTAPNYL